MVNKTPEELAEEYLRKMWGHDGDATEEMHCVSDFLGGYQAAQEKYEARIKELEQVIIKSVDAMAGVQYDDENT
jgi:hypothetical protein